MSRCVYCGVLRDRFRFFRADLPQKFPPPSARGALFFYFEVVLLSGMTAHATPARMEDGTLFGAADPRRDGKALGY